MDAGILPSESGPPVTVLEGRLVGMVMGRATYPPPESVIDFVSIVHETLGRYAVLSNPSHFGEWDSLTHKLSY